MYSIPNEYSWIQMNPDLEKAFNLLYNTNEHLNIIGPAGVGKTLLLKIICTDKAFGNTVVLSSTGIAAVNASSEGIKGSTIHSFFKIKPQTIYGHNSLKIHEELYEIVNNIDTILLDEVSMVNASLFDFLIETILLYRSKRHQNLPRFILFGDILQLPPVIENDNKSLKEYFHMLYNDNVMYFNCNSFSDLGFKTIHLNTIYRQSDSSIQNILNRVRQATHTIEDLNILNQYVIDEGDFWERHESFLHITTTNKVADLLNLGDLNANPNRIKHYEAKITGNVPESFLKSLPQQVSLKKDLQVMCIRNDPTGMKTFQNGTIGIVQELYDDYIIIQSKGKSIHVPRATWDVYDYKITNNDDKTKVEVVPEKVGSFNQLAVKGARAITTHKAQGQTIEKAYIDLGYKVFAPGLAYVALSRVPNFDAGLGLKRKVRMNDIYANKESLEFLSKI